VRAMVTETSAEFMLTARSGKRDSCRAPTEPPQAVLGSVFAFLVAWVVAHLIRRVTGVSEPPALVIVAAGVIGGYFRRRLAWGAPKAAPELGHPEPAVAAPPGLLPSI
jgi:hypothetical protein